jgi:hypothetical protein
VLVPVPKHPASSLCAAEFDLHGVLNVIAARWSSQSVPHPWLCLPLQTSKSGRQVLEARYSDPLEPSESGDASSFDWDREPILNLVAAVLGCGVLGGCAGQEREGRAGRQGRPGVAAHNAAFAGRRRPARQLSSAAWPRPAAAINCCRAGFPFCFKTCGLGLALVLVLVTLAAAELSMRLLLAAAQLTGKRSYEELARHTHGRGGQLAVDVCVLAMNVGSLVAYLNILTDTVSTVAGAAASGARKGAGRGCCRCWPRLLAWSRNGWNANCCEATLCGACRRGLGLRPRTNTSATPMLRCLNRTPAATWHRHPSRTSTTVCSACAVTPPPSPPTHTHPGTVIPPGAEPSRTAMLWTVTVAGCLPVALFVKSAQLLTAVSSLSMAFLLSFCCVVALLPFSPTPNTGAWCFRDVPPASDGGRVLGSGGAAPAERTADAGCEDAAEGREGRPCMPRKHSRRPPRRTSPPRAPPPAGPLLWWRWEGVLVAFPIVSYGFTAHQYLFQIYPPGQRPSMRRMTAVVQRGMLLSAAIYVAVGAGGYTAFGARCVRRESGEAASRRPQVCQLSRRAAPQPGEAAGGCMPCWITPHGVLPNRWPRMRPAGPRATCCATLGAWGRGACASPRSARSSLGLG